MVGLVLPLHPRGHLVGAVVGMTALDMLHAQLLADGEDADEMACRCLKDALRSLAAALGVLDGRPDQAAYLRDLLEMHDKEDDGLGRLAAMLVTAASWVYDACSGGESPAPEQPPADDALRSLPAVQIPRVLNLNTLPSGCIRGMDGKTYPERRLDPETRRFLAAHVHSLSHGGMSVRQVVSALAEETGERRSVGWVAGILRDWRCEHCSGARFETPEQHGAVVGRG